MSNKETLEEVAEKQYNYDSYEAFIRGAKWQQEQDKNNYSEEDMKQFALKCVITYIFNKGFVSDNIRIPIERNNNNQFEQFKKK